MTDLHELLTDAVADVRPGYALDDIRARTTPARRRWPYAAGVAVLAIAASFIAFAVLSPDNAPRATDPASTTPPAHTTSATEPVAAPVAVYFVGDTPDGPRLYRELRPSDFDGDALKTAMAAVLTQPPQDPDYRSLWPATGTYLRHVDVVDGVIRVDIGTLPEAGNPADVHQLAIQQVIYSAQAAVGAPLPVQFMHDGNPVAEVLGQPTSEPLAEAPLLETLAHVSITTPSEGMLVDNDEPLVVEGVGNSFEGNIVTWVEDRAGTVVVDQTPTIAGTYEEKLFPYQVTLDLTGLPAGDYLVVSSTDDPSGQGREHTDSRRITVVD